MTCTTYQELLSAWLDGELSSFEQRELREHLDQCPGCRTDWEVMGRIQEQIDRLVEPGVPPELWERITTAPDKDVTPPASSDKIIYYTTARGRMLEKKKGKASCLNTRFSRPPSH